MKTIIMLLVILFTASTLFAQFMMVKDSNGDIKYQRISKTDKITFGTPPTFINCGDIVSFTDGGETVYFETVQIGTQCWFKENLNVGTMIQSTTGGQQQTDNETIEKYCYDNNESNCDTYGGLYEWNEAMQYVTTEGTQGICPNGWHIPTYSELQTLEAAVGGDGNALKAVGQGAGSGAGTNTSGFSALLAGYRSYGYGTFHDLGSDTYFWSSTENSSDYTRAYRLLLGSNNGTVGFGNEGKYGGFSIRCIKD